MGLNKYKSHLFVLPEDDSNRQIANGFLLNPALNDRVIQVLPVVGGWTKVVDEFKNVHVYEMQKYYERRIVLLIDFDQHAEQRLLHLKNEIPEQLIDRVFVLGTLSEPENLRANLKKSFEDIGKALSKDCADDTWTTWGHDLLKHNQSELDRIILFVKSFLFT